MEPPVFRPAEPDRILRKKSLAVATPRRLHPSEYVGVRRYFLTICTYRRSRYFVGEDTVDRVRTQFLRIADGESFKLFVYCFMPDHVHALACAATAGADLRRFIRLAKQRSGFEHMRTSNERLWQKSYFDRTLREDEDSRSVIKYIVNNPLRRGLVEAPASYPHWGSQIYSREEILDWMSADGTPAV